MIWVKQSIATIPFVRPPPCAGARSINYSRKNDFVRQARTTQTAFSEIVVICELFRRQKQHASVAKLPQQWGYAPQHPGVGIDDKNDVPI